MPSTVRSENGDSGTNVQESGVDEPDVVKTDGRTLFRVEDDDLVTYDVTGAEVERIGSADLEDLDDGEVLLSGDRLVVIGTDGGGSGDLLPRGPPDPGHRPRRLRPARTRRSSTPISTRPPRSRRACTATPSGS